jgi:hypothetical protein
MTGSGQEEKSRVRTAARMLLKLTHVSVVVLRHTALVERRQKKK